MKKIAKKNSILLILSIILISLLYYNIAKGYNYEVFINNKSIGIIENKQSFIDKYNKTQNSINNRFTNILGKDKIDFKKIAKINHISTENEILNSYLMVSNIKVKAIALMYNHKCLALVDNTKNYNNIINQIKKDYEDEFEIKNISQFNIKNLELKKCLVPISNIYLDSKKSNEIAKEVILKNKNNLDISFRGEQDILKTFNPATVKKPSDELIQGKTKLETKGENGIKCISMQVNFENNKIQSKNVLKESVVKNSKNKIILIGQKVPKDLKDECFIKPATGFISSGFGRRWGRMHKGIDIAASFGNPIYAAAKGVVEFSGWQNGYGNIIILKHNDGFETRYGHCSKLLVKVGDTVNVNQHIANVGSTGRSTGPHVHFEVRKNNIAINPIKYLK